MQEAATFFRETKFEFPRFNLRCHEAGNWDHLQLNSHVVTWSLYSDFPCCILAFEHQRVNEAEDSRIHLGLI